MTDPDGEAASRLEETTEGRVEPAVDPAASESSYELPEIVPATIETPVAPVSPALPSRPEERPVAGVAATTSVPRSAPPATSWADHMMPASMPAVGAPAAVAQSRDSALLRAPGRRPRVRRVTRVVRHVDPWSVFKVALVFNVVGYLVVLTSGVLLWRVAESTGTIDNVERWFTQFGWETFELKGGEIFSNAWIIGLFAAVGLTGAAVLAATLFNLVSDIVGGVRVTVLEEEVVERTAASTRRYVVRRPPVGDTALAGSSQWSVDDDDPIGTVAPAPASPARASAAVAGSSDWSVDDDPL